jgi:hypothetical protein
MRPGQTSEDGGLAGAEPAITGSLGEQAALRRVATLVAREAAPQEVFAAAAEEGRGCQAPITRR